MSDPEQPTVLPKAYWLTRPYWSNTSFDASHQMLQDPPERVDNAVWNNLVNAIVPEAQKFRVIHPSQYIIFISIILLLRVIPGAFIDQSWWMWVGYAYYCAAFLGVQCYFDAVILPHNARVVDTIEGILQQHNQEQLHRNYMLECPRLPLGRYCLFSRYHPDYHLRYWPHGGADIDVLRRPEARMATREGWIAFGMCFGVFVGVVALLAVYK